MSISIPVLDLEEFRRRMKAGDVVDACIRKQYIPEDVKASSDKRQVTFTISTGVVDRQGDTISVAGWHLDNFLKNPVVLFAHRYDQLPIGRAVAIEKTATSLRSTVEFVDASVPIAGPLAEAVYQMLKGGFLRSTSVGFRPLKSVHNEERPGWAMDFIEQELLEYSVVPVPCNPEAVMDTAKGLVAAGNAGIEIAPLAQAVLMAKGALDLHAKGGRKFSAANAKLIKDAHACSDQAIKHLKALIDQMEEEAEAAAEEDEDDDKAEAPEVVKEVIKETYLTIPEIRASLEASFSKVVLSAVGTPAGKE